jgi:siroheme synthase-like protein
MTERPLEDLPFLPVALDLQDKSCLVVGGGGVGTRKVRTLLRTGARITVVSPSVTRELAALAEAGHVHWVEGPFVEAHWADVFLVVAATDDERLNAAIVRWAAQNRALVCDASSAERSQVIFGALLQAEDATIAVFTGGRDPARARSTRDRIADLLDRSPHNKSDPADGIDRPPT